MHRVYLALHTHPYPIGFTVCVCVCVCLCVCDIRRQIRVTHGEPKRRSMALLRAEFGRATWLPTVQGWLRTVVRVQPGAHFVQGAVYMDGSALFPKHPQIRVAN